MFQDFQSLKFSELFMHNVDVKTVFSLNGHLFAAAYQCQLLIFHTDLKEITQKFICDHQIDQIEWSPDSELIYCSMLKQNIIQIWSLVIPTWRCKIAESPLAIHQIYWAPGSRHLLVVSEFHIKITVWSLVSSIYVVLENAKPIKNCITFSNCARYLAVAERKKHDDCISIYTCDTWEILKSFPVETRDFVDVCFSPSHLVIAILESFTEEYKVLFYSVDGRLLGKHGKSSNFGLNCLSWSPNGNFIALGDFYGKVTIFHASYYQEITSYHHSEIVESENVVVYRVTQKSSGPKYQETCGTVSNWELYKVVKGRPVTLVQPPSSTEKVKSKFLKSGIQNLKFSHDGQYIASISGYLPKLIYIFDKRKLKMTSIIQHQQKIKSMSWHPDKPILAICASSHSLDVWTPHCCMSLMSPFKDQASLNEVDWCPKRDCLVLNAKDQTSILYLPEISAEALPEDGQH